VTPALVNLGATLSGVTAGLRRLVGKKRKDEGLDGVPQAGAERV
jgi:hypothetical protein